MSFREGYNNHGYFLITEIMSSKHLSTENLLEPLWIMNIQANKILWPEWIIIIDPQMYETNK